MSNLFFLTLFSLASLNISFALEPDDIINRTEKVVAIAENFISILENHKKDLSKCEPIKARSKYILCDGTTIGEKELKTLFKKTPSELILFAEGKKIKYEILCKDSERETFKKWCKINVDRTFFKEVTSLHGQYVPAEKTIVIHSDAYKGSFIHEYIHFLQHQNKNKKYGIIYKNDRVIIQSALVRSLDEIINEVTMLERAGKKEQAKKWIRPASKIGDELMKFSFWQKIIDERNIFQLYILFGKEFGASTEDIDLAKKNMGFLCSEDEIKKLLPDSECKI